MNEDEGKKKFNFLKIIYLFLSKINQDFQSIEDKGKIYTDLILFDFNYLFYKSKILIRH